MSKYVEQAKQNLASDEIKPQDKTGATADYDAILKRFADYMRQRRYSKNSIENYCDRLRSFFLFCQKTIFEISDEDFDRFNRNYILKSNLSAAYQTQFVSALKLFYEKIERKKLTIERLERPKCGRKLPEILAREDIAKIINATDNIKHKAMLSLIYSCGLRRNELLDMKITAIDSKQYLIKVKNAKGNKDRVVPLSPKILELLRSYYKEYKPLIWLFEGPIPGKRYTGQSLHRVFVNAMQKAGIKGDYTLHTLRHSFATHLLQSGVNIRLIQELLGHRFLKTTEVYLHVGTNDIKNIQSPFDTLNLGKNAH